MTIEAIIGFCAGVFCMFLIHEFIVTRLKDKYDCDVVLYRRDVQILQGEIKRLKNGAKR